MKKIEKFSEFAYIIGIIALAFGTALMTRADLGISMVVAPAYLISEAIGPVTFGMAEYMLQAVLLIIMCLVIGKFKISYVFSFVTAFIYGCILDGFLYIAAFIPTDVFGIRLGIYFAGMLITAMAVSLMFHTYLSPAVYELAVREVSGRFKLNMSRFKIAYDCGSCLVAIIMSLLIFGGIRGIGWGTVVCALVNGLIIGAFSRFFEKHIEFTPLFPKLRRVFDK